MNNFTILNLKSKIIDTFLIFALINYYPEFHDST